MGKPTSLVSFPVYVQVGAGYDFAVRVSMRRAFEVKSAQNNDFSRSILVRNATDFDARTIDIENELLGVIN